MRSNTPAEAIAQIGAALQRGDLAAARALAEAARCAHPDEAGLAAAAGELALQAGDIEAAIEHFAEAVAAEPHSPDYAIDLAGALERAGAHKKALAALAPHEARGATLLRYAAARANLHQALGEPAEAARWHDRALALDPLHGPALAARARLALERGEADALARFDRALKVSSGDARLWLGKAQALECAGDRKGARAIAEQLCAQAPGFIAALRFLAGLRLAAGEPDFALPFAEAARKAPRDPNIAAAHVETLAGLDRSHEACAVAAAARARFPGEPHFALLEAIHASSAGEWDRAEAIFAGLPANTPQRALHEARHALRARDLERTLDLLERALAQAPWDIAAWALRGIAWRLAQDDRAHWLHEQPGLVELRPLIAREGLIEEASEALRALHEGAAMPLGQSLRGGTQTRGILFHRTEPVIAELHAAIRATLEAYRAQLPPTDPDHPLLRHGAREWQLEGSWSVRLSGGGGRGGDHHAAHIHPQGILSSALYCVVPPATGQGERGDGCLEIGRPPPNLGLDLEPIRTIRPLPGHLALFPSTLYHGTTPFAAAERMTVAFDVAPTD
ncbi:MAG: tetratricopeptide repeat protein [Erythrobacter sp.]|jgi:tetratricopeptide (TPR) repeat protein|nr:tetratricopeptide repeat protein [Erythrobacter sp.]